MTSSPAASDFLRAAAVGAGATLVLDAWVLLLRRLGVPTMNFALLGRWVGHLLRGTWKHESIARSRPVAHEVALGWVAHYATGVAFALAFALAFAAACGAGWLHDPTALPAIAFGLLTVAAPFLVMQPAMGLGIAASNTPAPAQNRLRSAGNHAVFGFGLYLAASCIASISR